MWWLINLLATARADQAYCPTLQCATLPTLVCAAAYGNIVFVNSQGCGQGICSLDMTLAWYNDLSNSTNSGDYFACQSIIFQPNLSLTTNTSCYTVESGQELATGIWPTTCLSDSDCQLQSGELATCKCGLNGNSYCTPPLTSTVFEEFWSTCAANETTDLNTRMMWDWTQKYYTDLLTMPSCSVFYELDPQNILTYTYSLAVWLSVGTVIILLA